MSKLRKFEHWCSGNIVKVSVSLVILIFLLNTLLFLKDDCNWRGTFGDQYGFANAICSALAFIGLIYTIVLQKKELGLQREELKLTRDEMKAQTESFNAQNHIMRVERFENTLFQMIQEHQDNVASLKVDNHTGRDCFPVFVKQLSDTYDGINKILYGITGNKIFVANDLPRIKSIISNLTSEQRREFIIALSYGIMFYGFDYKTNHKPDSDLAFLSRTITKLANESSTGPVVGGNIRNQPRSSQLGHYYRHLFHVVKFVDKQIWMSSAERYEYVKLLRAQLSDYEQILLYYNAVSPLGAPWIRRDSECDDGGAFVYSLLIKYRLIKNIPHFFHYFYCDPRERFKKELSLWECTHEDCFFEQLRQM